VDGLRRSTCSLRSPKKKTKKIRVFVGLFFTLLEKGVCASRENQNQQAAGAKVCVRFLACVEVRIAVVVVVVLVLGVFVVECVFSSASSVEQGFWLCFVEGGFFFPFRLG
jgi:hypothetical protein